MSIKIKILKENKVNINESLTSMLTDPMVVAGLLGVAALGKAALNQAANAIARGAETPEQTFNRILGSDWEAQAQSRLNREKAQKHRHKKQLDAMKADRAAAASQGGQVQLAIGMNDEAPEDTYIPPDMINRYINIKAMALGGFGSESDSAKMHMARMEEKYPGIGEHPEVVNAEKLNEMFMRFLA